VTEIIAFRSGASGKIDLRLAYRLCLDEHMELVEFARLSEQQRVELEGDERDPWDAGGSTLLFRPKERHVALRHGQGPLVASAGMVVVEAEVGPQRFPVVGLGGVIVNRQYRGRGLARGVVTAALAQAGQLGPEFMLLFCHADRVGLYRKLGFVEVEYPVTVEQPDGPVEMTMRTMWRALRPGALWPDGSVSVCSLPF
jgi:predicted GNAT family N-acyltransferase